MRIKCIFYYLIKRSIKFYLTQFFERIKYICLIYVQVLDIYDCGLGLLRIGPFNYDPLRGVDLWLAQSDQFILQHLSTSPEVEQPHFVSQVMSIDILFYIWYYKSPRKRKISNKSDCARFFCFARQRRNFCFRYGQHSSTFRTINFLPSPSSEIINLITIAEMKPLVSGNQCDTNLNKSQIRLRLAWRLFAKFSSDAKYNQIAD